MPADCRGNDYRIHKYAFAGCGELLSVKIPDKIDEIGDYAFADCINLIAVTIPDKVQVIGNYAFDSCSGIRDLSLGKKLHIIGSGAFRNCTSLTSVVIPDEVGSISYEAFKDCCNLVSVTLGRTINGNDIASDTFYGCEKLVEVNSLAEFQTTDSWISPLIKGTTRFGYLGYYALNICTVESGETKTFETDDGFIFYANGNQCYLMGYKGDEKELVLPTDCQGKDYEIYKNAFSGCDRNVSVEKIEKIIISDGVTKIGEWAFAGLSNLKEVVIGDSVTHIGKYAFDNRELEKMTIGKSVSYIDSNAFGGKISYLNYTGETADWCSITFESNPIESAGHLHINGELLTDLVVPNTVTKINEYAFKNCGSITSITIGDGVTGIGDRAFEGCIKLVAIYNLSSLRITKGSSDNGYVGYYALNIYTTDEDKKTFVTDDEFVFYDDGELRCLLGYIGDKTEINLPDNCNGYSYEIYQYAFKNCNRLTSVTIPDGITSIGKRAFDDCISLTSIVMPYSVTIIGDCAFDDCISLTSIVIPYSVTIIGDSAFCDCTSLTSIVIPDSVVSIGDFAFSNCDGITIFCEAETEPNNWNPEWDLNEYGYGYIPKYHTVVWGYKAE